MREYLIFQLYGPLASWGDIAVGEDRRSDLIPTKSAILGLITAAIGLKRPDTVQSEMERADLEEQHKLFAKRYGVAARLDAVGIPIIDYHTSEVPSGKGYATRRDEVLAILNQKKSGVPFKGTVLSRREYRQDVFCAVAIWGLQKTFYSLTSIRSKLLEPTFLLYLGRKACPLSLPLDPKIVSAATMEDAMSRICYPPRPDYLFKRLAPKGRSLFVWDYEAEAETNLTPMQTIIRRDEVHSRLRWQFSTRRENQTYVQEGGAP